MELFFGNLVIEPEKASEQLNSVKYSAMLKRPVWQIRWGTSLAVRGDDTGDKGAITEGSGGKRPSSGFQDEEFGPSEFGSGEFGMEAGGMGRGNNATANLDQTAEAELEEALGLVAEVIAEQFSVRFSRGDFGLALSSIAPPPSVVATPDNNEGDSMEQEMDEAMERERMEQERMRMEQEQMDMEMERSMASGSEFGSNRAAEMEAVAPLDDTPKIDPGLEPFPMWKPGIVYLGSVSSAEATKKAKARDIDFILHFDVILKEGREGAIQNISRCRMIRVADGKTIGLSKASDSVEVQRPGTVARDYVNEQVANLFAIIDRQMVLADMPKLSPEIAKRRIASLFSGSKADRIKALAEIRLYQSQQLISDEDAEKAFHIVGGADGMRLLYGTQEDQIATVHEWVTEALTIEE
ncbi:signal peptide protein [Rhodopirellula maiorica SM1]|uniref:Signal peptide protein n=1 Tax=Rhodopirellula maiorica SM1 TaxID=1265738 RepID=M5RUZ0_9BACT|nr:signal peptide protein [Rhodopirellula maiorica SM1]